MERKRFPQASRYVLAGMLAALATSSLAGQDGKVDFAGRIVVAAQCRATVDRAPDGPHAKVDCARDQAKPHAADATPRAGARVRPAQGIDGAYIVELVYL
ncbi:hypothetical protein WKR98_06785 [Pigmentiphaga sp. YJ18]|uniref:hypothetical protein n=1 Tax=Pigmentiphaga sp. YJ18 TaxID=3134907 RepID=UPI00311907CB